MAESAQQTDDLRADLAGAAEDDDARRVRAQDSARSAESAAAEVGGADGGALGGTGYSGRSDCLT